MPISPYQTDIAGLQQKQALAQMLMQNSMNQGGYQSPFSSLANVLSATLAAKQYKDLGQQQTDLTKQYADQQKLDMSRALSAYRGDTPYQAETFGPEDQLPPGLMNMGKQQNTNALLSSLLESSSPELQSAALKAMIPSSASNNSPYYTPVYYADAQGNPKIGSFNARSGTMEQVMTGGQPVARTTDSPTLQGKLSQAKSEGGKVGSETGVAKSNLADIESALPRLNELVGELSDLGKTATYTTAGQFYNSAMRQLGMEVPEGAVARKEYITKVDNEILPLLRQTFGAQFTEREGNSLKATLGDPDASPEEKDAVLRSFIQTKIEQVKTLQRRTGAEQSLETPQIGTIIDGYKFMGGDPSDKNNWQKQ